jgi:alpha-L-fucosidase
MLQPDPTPGDTNWFVHDRFGLFIHWGLYALGARHEWLKHNEKIDNETYEKYFKHFDPDLYDPAAWADAAWNAGMKYFVVTTKHHEGFCLWDSALTDYKATNTPYGKDVLRPMVDAFRGRGMKVGFYHSLIDWHHPDFTIDRIHPMRDRKDEWAKNPERDIARYRAYLHGQTRELLSQFGKIDVLWYDFSYGPEGDDIGKGKADWGSEDLIKLIRELQPHIVLNDRLEIDQDIKTPEQFQPRAWVHVDGKPAVWEACQTFSGSWGYHRDEESWKSVDLLVKMLIDNVSKGGNLLLNVGPTGRGEIDERALERLKGMGEWMRRHGRSIHGCTQAPADFPVPEDCRYTYNPETNRLYLHVLSWPFGRIYLDGMADRIEYAQLLNDASELKIVTGSGGFGPQSSVDAKTIALEIPVKKPNVTVPVIELFLN